MKLGSLFAGIGGFELAATWAGIEPIWSNENAPFCCRVLRKNFKHEIIEADIRNIGKHNLKPVDILTGGDPCQPNSVAGLGKGTADVRFLWPEMFRIAQELNVPWIVNENVGGSISNGVLDLKIDDLEGAGYSCQAYCVPAEAVGALHQRERVWLVAHDASRYATGRITRNAQTEKLSGRSKYEMEYTGESIDLRYGYSYPYSKRLEELNASQESGILQEGVSRHFGFGPNPHGNISRDILESGIIRMLDGLPEGMDYADRGKRLKALGNAVVPQILVEIFKAIQEVENQMI